MEFWRKGSDAADDFGVAGLGSEVEGVDPGLVRLGAGVDCVGNG